jgi:predicted 2-oxoglutarate/Fe(II)-dependent dioxygenase YbiX
MLAFLPAPGPERDQAMAALRANRHLFDDRNWCLFGVVRGEEDFNTLQPDLPGIRYFHDADGAIAEMYGLEAGDGATVPQWVIIDPSMRILGSLPIAAAQRTFEIIRRAGEPDAHAGVPMHAPVLIVPRVFEPDFCRQLIDVYKKDGGGVSGVMRDVGGRTVGVIDDSKKRRDANVEDEEMQLAVQRKIRARLLPQIQKAFMFNVTRMERYIVARYDAVEGGYFRAHRDNTTRATAHRQFACSINLNAEEFEGGDLRFPEFGKRTYRPPTGGAVIFSCSLLHEATPVTAGTRFAFLPFLYDDASAKIRQENARFLDSTKPGVVREPAQA